MGSIVILTKKWWARILLCMLALFPCACIEEEDDTDAAEDVVKVGDRLPDFTVTMNDGGVVTGDSLRKVVSVVMFFHTSCPDCQQALPRVQSLYDNYASEDIAFVLISREEEAASIADFWQANGLKLPYSPQPDRRVYEQFAYRRVPRIYVSNWQGVVKHIFTDNPVPTFEELEEALHRVLAE